MDEWDEFHLRPLIDGAARRHAVRADVLLALGRELRGAVTVEDDGQGNTVLTGHGRGLLDAAEWLDHLVDELARRELHA